MVELETDVPIKDLKEDVKDFFKEYSSLKPDNSTELIQIQANVIKKE